MTSSVVAASDKGGEPIAPLHLRSLFDGHYASIWRLLRRLGVPGAQLDDAAQEVFWVAARRLTDIEPGREHAFLYGVALRIASNVIRRQSPVKCCALEQHLHVVDERPSPEEHCQQRQLREVLDEVLSLMSEELRTVFVLCEIEELEVKEVAELVGIPVGTASSRLRRAREEFSVMAKRVRLAMQTRGGYR